MTLAAGREEKIRALKEEIVSSANSRVAGSVQARSAREKNLLLNHFEYSIGRIHLESTPEGVGIGAHYNCNARCIFCLGGKPKLFTLQRYREFFEPRLGRVITNARYVNFCGFGEILLMPGIEDFLAHINATIPAVNKIFTTNGTSLCNEKVSDLLTQSKFAVEISLHAPAAPLHKTLTRMDAFDRIIEAIKRLMAWRKSNEQPTIVLVFLANTLNIESLPDFVHLAADLGVDQVMVNYLTVFHYSHLKFSCFFKQAETNESFAKAAAIARERNIPLRLPPRFGDTSPGACSRCGDPWKYFYVENEASVLPCCFAGDHVGYLGKADFETIWNGSHYKNLRASLISNGSYEWCGLCYRHSSENVNDIRAHINFRPGRRERILRGSAA